MNTRNISYSILDRIYAVATIFQWKIVTQIYKVSEKELWTPQATEMGTKDIHKHEACIIIAEVFYGE